MKKYFIFAAVATAGLFASCSSSDDALSQAPNVVENSEGRPAISIGIGTPAGLDTRGTGTVGGVGTGANATPNAWHGQEINVFMFTKDATTKATTLNLTPGETANTFMYNNLAMYTPGTDDNKIPGMDVAAASGEAMIKDGTINYYPLQGNFDFFGYHGDDAVTGAVDDTDNAKWTVPFTIDGSQDLMSTKAALTADQIAIPGVGTTYEDYYSAKAARKGVQPTLTFKHLLTRLSFCVVAGNDAAAGTTTTTDTKTKAEYDALTDQTGYEVATYGAVANPHIDKATYDALTDDNDKALFDPTDANDLDQGYDVKAANATIAKSVYDAITSNGVKALFAAATYVKTTTTTDATAAVQIKSIKIKSKATGDLAVAWTTDLADADKIAWSADPAVQMTLKERAAYKKLANAAAATGADLYDTYAGMSAADQATADAEAAQLEQDKISAATFAKFTATGQAKYEQLTNAEKEQLIALTPTSPTIDATKADKAAGRYPETAIGEALIVAPSTDEYEMEVEVTQKVKTNWTTADVDTKTQTQTLMIPVPANTGIGGAAAGFLQNTSYNVKLTVYGFERIVVNAVVEPWAQGEDLEVGED